MGKTAIDQPSVFFGICARLLAAETRLTIEASPPGALILVVSGMADRLPWLPIVGPWLLVAVKYGYLGGVSFGPLLSRLRKTHG